jgi:hypothetical protein
MLVSRKDVAWAMKRLFPCCSRVPPPGALTGQQPVVHRYQTQTTRYARTFPAMISRSVELPLMTPRLHGSPVLVRAKESQTLWIKQRCHGVVPLRKRVQ